MKRSSIKIAIADDNALVKAGLSQILLSVPFVEVVIDLDIKQDLIDQLSSIENMPELLLIEVSIPSNIGGGLIRQICTTWPDTKIIAMSNFKSEYLMVSSLLSGARGFIHKKSSKREIIDTVESITNNGRYYSDSMLECLHKYHLGDLGAFPKLTDKELEFLQLCCKDITYKEVADIMNVGKRTVENYRVSLNRKLNINHRSGLIIFAIEAGIIDMFEGYAV